MASPERVGFRRDLGVRGQRVSPLPIPPA